MASDAMEYFSKLPKKYRPAANAPLGWQDDDDDDVASIGTCSWRTFSTSSAPSELLSFHRDRHLHTLGRAINRLGKWIVNPLDNAMARREFRKVIQYVGSLETEDDWATAKRIFQTHDVLSSLLEAGR
jgi:hypothetical protein